MRHKLINRMAVLIVLMTLAACFFFALATRA